MILDYIVSVLTYMLIYIIVVQSFNLAYGFTGLVNLGHMVFFGAGAYASALLTLNGIPWYLAILSAGFLAALLGAAMASITVRLKGDYFQVATLGLVFMATALSRNWISLTRGALGLPGVPNILNDRLAYMLFVLAVTSISLIFFYWLVNSETGKIFRAIRDDETAAMILGKNTYFYKILSISISTFFAGIGGSLFVHFINYVDPTTFDLGFFVIILSMLILGGLASIAGSIVGVVLVTLITESLRFVSINPDMVGAFREMTFIAIVLLVLIYRPKGIFGKVTV